MLAPGRRTLFKLLALRDHVERRQENLEDTLRRVVREEVQRMGPKKK